LAERSRGPSTRRLFEYWNERGGTRPLQEAGPRSLRGHCSGPWGARHSCGARRQMVCCSGVSIVGGRRQPFRRKHRRRRSV